SAGSWELPLQPPRLEPNECRLERPGRPRRCRRTAAGRGGARGEAREELVCGSRTPRPTRIVRSDGRAEKASPGGRVQAAPCSHLRKARDATGIKSAAAKSSGTGFCPKG